MRLVKDFWAREATGNKKSVVFIVHGTSLFGWIQREDSGQSYNENENGLKKIDEEIVGVNIRGIRAADRSRPDHLIYMTKN